MLKFLCLLSLVNISQKMDIKKVQLKKWIGLIKLKLMRNHSYNASSQHWSKRWIWGDGNTNRSLWGSFLIEYKDKKIFFACDTGPAPFYKELGKKLVLSIWVLKFRCYNFYPIVPVKDRSTAHANPEELLSLMKDLEVKKLWECIGELQY